MTKHTPGPWTTHYDEPQSFSGWSDAGGYRIDADGIEQLAYVWSRSNRLMGNGAPQSAGPEFGAKDAEANARLIAAAPDMLAELEQALSCLRQYRDYGEAMRSIGRGFQAIDTVGRTIDYVILGIESAIAKAKGE